MSISPRSVLSKTVCSGPAIAGRARGRRGRRSTAAQLRLRHLSPAPFPPTLEEMRRNAPHNPAVEPVEELSDVGSLVVMSPSPQHWIQFLWNFQASLESLAGQDSHGA